MAASGHPLPIPTKIYRTNTYPTLSFTRPELSTKGKNMAITGGGTGIGAETAKHFAAAGASSIALFGRREQPLLDTKAAIEKECPGVKVFTQSTDVADRAQVEDAFANFMKTTASAKIDVLISNAAKTGPMQTVQDADPIAFMDAVNVNIGGSLNVAQAFLKYAAPDAVIVDVNSSAAHVNFAPAVAAYNVAKLGQYRLWDCVGFANPKMSVFHIQPGVVDTDMNREAGGVKAAGMEDHVSLPASFMLWLASPEARFLNGKFLWSNWDVDELLTRAKEIQESEQFQVQVVGWPWADGVNGGGKWAPPNWKFNGVD